MAQCTPSAMRLVPTSTVIRLATARMRFCRHTEAMAKMTCCCCAGDDRLAPDTAAASNVAGRDAPAGCAFTVGHSTRPIDEFIGLLTAHGITQLIDVRTVPKSRHNPQFETHALAKSLV